MMNLLISSSAEHMRCLLMHRGSSRGGAHVRSSPWICYCCSYVCNADRRRNQ